MKDTVTTVLPFLIADAVPPPDLGLFTFSQLPAIKVWKVKYFGLNVKFLSQKKKAIYIYFFMIRKFAK